MITTFEAARDEFALRYFDWCMNQTQRAGTESFARARCISGFNGALFQDFLDEFGSTEALKCCTACLKKNNRRVLAMRGEQLTLEEIANSKRFANFSRVLTGGVEIARVPTRIQARRQQIMTGDCRLASDAEIRKTFSQLLVKRFGPLSVSRSGLLQFRREVNTWSVSTNIEFRDDNIRYSHIISGMSELGPHAGIIETSISYLAWLGLPGTEWEYATVSELPSIASLLIEFIELFLEALPDLLKGIQNPLKIS